MEDTLRKSLSILLGGANKHVEVASKLTIETATNMLKWLQTADNEARAAYGVVEETSHAMVAEMLTRQGETNYLLRAIVLLLMDGKIDFASMPDPFIGTGLGDINWDDIEAQLESLLKDMTEAPA